MVICYKNFPSSKTMLVGASTDIHGKWYAVGPVNFYKLIISEEILLMIAEETNRYAKQFIQKGISQYSHYRAWHDTDFN